MIIDSRLLQHRVTRILPHIIDTVLLVSGISLAVWIYGEFYKYPWLVVKLVAVAVYIFLGGIAIRYGKTKKVRVGALILSLAAFFTIVAIARFNSVIAIGGLDI